jgi:hypothetical protein
MMNFDKAARFLKEHSIESRRHPYPLLIDVLAHYGDRTGSHTQWETLPLALQPIKAWLGY